MNHDMHIHEQHQSSIGIGEWMVGGLCLTLVLGYVIAAVMTSRTYRSWPVVRCIYWFLGIACAASAVIGPVAHQAHTDFTYHMVAHLLLGMIAPLFIVFAAPMTLILRTIPVPYARKITTVIKTRYIRFVSDPVVAAVFNIGGLWLLYTTDLYVLMHQYFIIHLLVHVHIFFAGYIFTAAIIPVDPHPYRTSYMYRAVILVIALAGHSILSKVIYAFPLTGVTAAEAQSGGLLMYYGGDAIEIVMISVLCFRWYQTAGVRPAYAALSNE